MPIASAPKPQVGYNEGPAVIRTSRPASASAAAIGVQRRRWNPPPDGLFPQQEKKQVPRSRPATAPRPIGGAEGQRTSRLAHPPTTATTSARRSPYDEHAQLGNTKVMTSAVSPLSTSRRVITSPRVLTTRKCLGESNKACVAIPQAKGQTPRGSSTITELQRDAMQRGSVKRVSQVTWARLQKEAEAANALSEDPFDRSETRADQMLQAHELDAATEDKRDAARNTLIMKRMRQQDVDAEDVRPLIDIAYWSPFLEVRRDAAAALASLSRNREWLTCALLNRIDLSVVYGTYRSFRMHLYMYVCLELLSAANIPLLSEVGTVGALLAMLTSLDNRVDPAIARDCAQTLAAMARLQSVKLKLLQSPDGIDCIFSLLHAPDLRLRCLGFEVVNNLVTTEELRQSVAKREGFAYLLESCTSKDSRIRYLAASILNHLAESRDNRFLFYHSTHFSTLASILHDPYMTKDAPFRRELLSFIRLLVAEEDNARQFVELNMLPTLLVIIQSPKTSHAQCLLIVLILESLALNRKNHATLVATNALPVVVQLCFCSIHGVVGKTAQLLSPSALPRPRTANGNKNSSSNSGCCVSMTTHVSSRSVTGAASPLTVVLSPDASALLRPAFTLFCEMAKSPVNREHIIRSKLVDYISARNLYAASDKRVRRSVITLLTFLICKERERERRASSTHLSRGESCSDLTESTFDYTDPLPRRAAQEAEFKHYIELLARGIVKCLFGILQGNDFSMKVDALAAIAQLTEDEHSRLTMCKPPLLRALKEFAFHPLVQTRTNIAQIIANFAERPENILKLLDEGMLAILVKYVCPISRNGDVLEHTTRALAAMSLVHVTRAKLVESGVLGTLLQFRKSPCMPDEVQRNARAAIRNLRHDAAALRIQSIYRGWCVRLRQASVIIARKRRVRKLASLRKLSID